MQFDNAIVVQDDELSEDEDLIEVLNIVLRAPRVIRDRTNHYEKWNNVEFKDSFRLSKIVVRYVVDKIAEAIVSRTDRNHALSLGDMVFVTLRYLATGSLLTVVGELSGIDKATASRAIRKVTVALARLRPDYIEMPSTEDEITKVRQGFYNICKFPRCVGALDCTHIKIQSPGGEDAERFRCRKGFFSYNVQAVCDSELIIRNIVCRWHGSAHDSTIFNNSSLKVQLENGDFGQDSLVVGDSGYGIKNYLITPLGNPQTRAEQLFNESQIRTRNPIERCFGAWKRRFLALAFGIRLHVSKLEAIVIAAALLHNIACVMNDAVPRVTEEEEAAVQLTINVNHCDNEAQNQDDRNINNLCRSTLINGHFAGLL